MTVEIISAQISSRTTVEILAVDVSEEYFQRISRNREDDGMEKRLNFVFDITSDNFYYLWKWLRRQKSVKEMQPGTWGEALQLIIGTITTISGKYLELE